MKFYNFAVKTVKSLLSVFILFRIKGAENIPTVGPFLLCANHHSNMDPVLLAAGCSRRLTFMAKEELFNVPVLRKVIKLLGAFPIKRGKGEAAAVMATLKILNRGDCTLIFPEGKRMKNGERKSVNAGIIKLASRSNVPIIPAYVGKRTVTYASPVYFEESQFDSSDPKELQLLADNLMDTIYSLK